MFCMFFVCLDLDKPTWMVMKNIGSWTAACSGAWTAHRIPAGSDGSMKKVQHNW